MRFHCKFNSLNHPQNCESRFFVKLPYLLYVSPFHCHLEKQLKVKFITIQNWLISWNFSKCSQFLHRHYVQCTLYNVEILENLCHKRPKNCVKFVLFDQFFISCSSIFALKSWFSYFITIADCIQINMDGSILFQ